MTRKRRSAKTRLRIFLAHKGVCHVCSGAISVGQLWDLDHVIPLALGGDDEEHNLAPAHRKTCHGSKTAAQDVPAIAKAKRREARHIGATAPKRPIASPGFAPSARQRRSSAPLTKPLPPRRSRYVSQAEGSRP